MSANLPDMGMDMVEKSIYNVKGHEYSSIPFSSLTITGIDVPIMVLFSKEIRTPSASPASTGRIPFAVKSEYICFSCQLVI